MKQFVLEFKNLAGQQRGAASISTASKLDVLNKLPFRVVCFSLGDFFAIMLYFCACKVFSIHDAPCYIFLLFIDQREKGGLVCFSPTVVLSFKPL